VSPTYIGAAGRRSERVELGYCVKMGPRATKVLVQLRWGVGSPDSSTEHKLVKSASGQTPLCCHGTAEDC
jgi:hypothetical protein